MTMPMNTDDDVDDNDEPRMFEGEPDIRRAWNFYYGRTLPRREVEDEDEHGMPIAWRKLEPVESGGELYSLFTPLSELGDFGLGIGLYFSSRVAMALMFGFIGFLNVFTIMAYYRSSDYAAGKGHLPYDLRASAICDRQVAVCLDRECKHIGYRSDCPMLCFEDGFIDIVSIGILLAYLALVTMSQQHIADKVDLREQTASDYSIVVQDPALNSLDPDEWRVYFSKFGHVTYVSVGVNNGKLLQMLARKRSVLMQLHKEDQIDGMAPIEASWSHISSKFYGIVSASLNHYRPLQTSDENDRKETAPKNKWHEKLVAPVKDKVSALKDKIATSQSEHGERQEWHTEDEENLNRVVESVRQSEASWRRREELIAHQESKDRSFMGHFWLVLQGFGLFRDSAYYRAEMHVIQRAIHNQMLKGPATAAKVFVTFETEHAQRAALAELKVSVLAAQMNLDMPREERFRFSNCLAINEAPEPREIMWCELDTTALQWCTSLLTGLTACTLFIIATWALLYVVKGSPWTVAIIINISNMVVAPLMIYITDQERHLTRESEHVWLFGKLVFTRWTISVVLLKIITPFTETISEHSITTIRNVLVLDTFFKPMVQALDIPGLFDHYVLSTFSRTQEKMNRLFLGSNWSLAERYSDMGKSIFMALSFAGIYPFAYFLVSFGSVLSFAADKYCLFRVWKQAEPENATLTSFHRSTLAMAFLAHCVFTLWYFADWPFDDLCPNHDHDMVFQWAADKLSFELQDHHVHHDCSMKHKGFILEVAGGRHYMTSSQHMLIKIYKAVTIFTGLTILLAYFGPGLYKIFKVLFIGHVENPLPPTEVRFSDVEFIEGYIPGLVDPMYNKPLLACSLDTLDTQHIHWEGNWAAYNLNSPHDFPGLSEAQRNAFFGTVQHYPVEKGEPKQNYVQYIEAHYPELLDLLGEPDDSESPP